MRAVPRPPASVPLGGSLRASRTAQLACPRGPLAAVDLADGRALTVEWLTTGWVAAAARDDPSELSVRTSPPAAACPASSRRRRRLGTGVVLAGALGAAAVALAAGLSGAPAPAVAGPTTRAVAQHRVATRPPSPVARGGRAAILPRAAAPATSVAPPASAPVPPPSSPAPPSPSPPAVVPPTAAPPLPELPSAPALARAPVRDWSR